MGLPFRISLMIPFRKQMTAEILLERANPILLPKKVDRRLLAGRSKFPLHHHPKRMPPSMWIVVPVI